MYVVTKATSDGLDTPLPKSQTVLSPCRQDSLCLGLDKEEDVWQDGKTTDPFTSSPPMMFVCLFVWRGVEEEEEEKMQDSRVEKGETLCSFNHLFA